MRQTPIIVLQRKMWEVSLFRLRTLWPFKMEWKIYEEWYLTNSIWSTTFILKVVPIMLYRHQLHKKLLINAMTWNLLSSSILISHSLQMYLQFIGWFAKNGRQIMGTLAEKLSIVEFHPPCVKNPPIDEWLSTCSCGQQLIINHLSLVSSKNSGGKTDDSLLIELDQFIHKKYWLLLISPHPTSNIFFQVTLPLCYQSSHKYGVFFLWV